MLYFLFTKESHQSKDKIAVVEQEKKNNIEELNMKIQQELIIIIITNGITGIKFICNKSFISLYF